MNATAIASRLIGDIFVEKGLITDKQLVEALEEQEMTGERLGGVLISRFGISRLELASALAEQLAEQERFADAEDPASGAEDTSALSLGSDGESVDSVPERILAASAIVTEPQLQEALERQRETGQRLGEILVEQGVLSRAHLSQALSEQLTSLEGLPAPSSASGDDESTVSGTPVDESPLADVVLDLRAAFDRLQAGDAPAQTTSGPRTSGPRLELIQDRVKDPVTAAELDERVHSLTSGMTDLSRLIDELAASLRQQRADVNSSVGGIVDRVAGLEQRLSAAATAAELDERIEKALAVHVNQFGSGLDALANDFKGVASSGDLNRVKRSVELLSKATTGADELAARRLEELETRTEEVAAGTAGLEATLVEIAERSRAADEDLRGSIVEVADRVEGRLGVERAEMRARLSEAVEKIQIGDAEQVSSLRGSIEQLAVQLAEQRHHLQAEVRGDVERLDERIEQQVSLAEQRATDVARTTELLELELERLESELRSKLERHADRIDEQRRAFDEVRDVSQRALQAAEARLTQKLTDVEQHTLASTESLKSGLGHLEARVEGQALAAAGESTAARAELEILRARLDLLGARLDDHEHQTVEETAEAQKDLDEARLDLGMLSDRVDVEGRATTRNVDAVRKNVDSLRSNIEQLAARLDNEAVRTTDALERSLAALRIDVEGQRETLAGQSATFLSEAKIALSGLQSELAESEKKQRQSDESLATRIEETRREVATVSQKLAEADLTRRTGDDLIETRIAGLEQQLAAETARAGEAAAAGRNVVAKAVAAVHLIELGLTDVALRSGANTAELERDLRAELAKRAAAHDRLQAQLEELAKSHSTRLAKAEETLQSSDSNELRGQLATLQSRVDEQASQALAQAEASDQLRASFAEIGSKLFERQQTFRAAGEELQTSLEELGRTIGQTETQIAQDTAEPEADGG